MKTLSKPGILILIKGLGLGGAERLLVDALPYLNRERFRYEFAYVLPWKDFLVPIFQNAGYKVHKLAGRNPLEPQVIWRLSTLVQKRNIRLIHAHLPLTGVLARVIGRFSRVPVVYTEHNLWERYHPLTRNLNAWTFRWNRKVFAVSTAVKSSILQHFENVHDSEWIEVLSNGVPVETLLEERSRAKELRKQLGLDEHILVGNVCVFRRQKRLDLWVNIAKEIVRLWGKNNLRFVLVGDGPERPLVKKLIRNSGLDSRFILPGFQENGRTWIAMMDVFFLTSEYEGLPMAVLESMAMGVPVIAPAVGGIPEVVRHGESGFIFSFESFSENPQSVAQEVVRLLSDERLRQSLGMRAREFVQVHHHLCDRVSRVEEVYQEILDRSV